MSTRRLLYGDGALQHLFYSKLLDCIKDKISCIGKPHTMPDLRVLAQSIDVRYWEHKSELNCQIFVTGHTTSIISAPTSSSMMPSNSKPTSDSSPSLTPSLTQAILIPPLTSLTHILLSPRTLRTLTPKLLNLLLN